MSGPLVHIVLSSRSRHDMITPKISMLKAQIPLARRAALVLLLLLALGIRLHGLLFEKRGLSYDESISYLCSSTSQGRYQAEFASIRDKEMTASDVQA
ncbi:MAG: hypothetical protein ABI373_01405, partial [Flavobacteriales bacterium]